LDEPFDGDQGVGVEAGRDQFGPQPVRLDGPSVADPFGLVEGGVGGKRIEFVPGQVVANR
jgi:hypothetical protein